MHRIDPLIHRRIQGTGFQKTIQLCSQLDCRLQCVFTLFRGEFQTFKTGNISANIYLTKYVSQVCDIVSLNIQPTDTSD